jgi:hypothetical protein
MNEINLTEKDIRLFIEEQKEKIPISSLFWQINFNKNEEKPNFFEFLSKPHNANTLQPVNFYKRTIAIINFDEDQKP